MRPAYAVLLRHPWLSTLMKPPTISEDEEAEAAAEAGADSSLPPLGGVDSHPETADKEVADWVRTAIQRKLSGKMGKSEKPALHAAPLDAIPGSPLLDREGLKPYASSTTSPSQSDNKDAGGEEEAADAAATAVPEPSDGVTVESPELEVQKIHSKDFADGVERGNGQIQSESEQGFETETEAPAP
jgi:hypothetical protein